MSWLGRERILQARKALPYPGPLCSECSGRPEVAVTPGAQACPVLGIREDQGSQSASGAVNMSRFECSGKPRIAHGRRFQIEAAGNLDGTPPALRPCRGPHLAPRVRLDSLEGAQGASMLAKMAQLDGCGWPKRVQSHVQHTWGVFERAFSSWRIDWKSLAVIAKTLIFSSSTTWFVFRLICSQRQEGCSL